MKKSLAVPQIPGNTIVNGPQVIPDCNVTGLPAVSHLELRNLDLVNGHLYELLALLRCEALNPLYIAITDKQAELTRLGVANNGGVGIALIHVK